MLLSESSSGKTVRILGYLDESNVGSKLRQLGLIPGECARILRTAPMGGPFLVEIRGRSIALGRKVAAGIQVEENSCDLP